MGKLANGATTPQSISELSEKVAQTVVNDAEASARRQYPAHKLGIRKEFNEFFRVTKVVEAKKNPDYVIVHVCEGSKLAFNKFEATIPYHVSTLTREWVGTTYLSKDMSLKDIDEDAMVTLESVVDEYLGEEHVDKDFFIYGVQALRYFVEEKPTDNWSAVDIVDEEGKVLNKEVYIKKRLVRMDGSPVETQE